MTKGMFGVPHSNKKSLSRVFPIPLDGTLQAAANFSRLIFNHQVSISHFSSKSIQFPRRYVGKPLINRYNIG